MPDAVSNTSPLLYLFRIGAIEWLRQLFTEVWVPGAVAGEIEEGRRKGYEVPNLEGYPWVRRVEPASPGSEWIARDLGPGELAVITLGLENPERTVLLDDALARRIAKAAGLTVWGTLRIVLEAKSLKLIDAVDPVLARLQDSGMWISDDIRLRVLKLAGEAQP